MNRDIDYVSWEDSSAFVGHWRREQFAREIFQARETNWVSVPKARRHSCIVRLELRTNMHFISQVWEEFFAIGNVRNTTFKIPVPTRFREGAYPGRNEEAKMNKGKRRSNATRWAHGPSLTVPTRPRGWGIALTPHVVSAVKMVFECDGLMTFTAATLLLSPSATQIYGGIPFAILSRSISAHIGLPTRLRANTLIPRLVDLLSGPRQSDQTSGLLAYSRLFPPPVSSDLTDLRGEPWSTRVSGLDTAEIGHWKRNLSRLGATPPRDVLCVCRGVWDYCLGEGGWGGSIFTFVCPRGFNCGTRLVDS